MAGLMKREPKSVDLFDRLDRMFDEWTRSFPLARLRRGEEELAEVIRVDEFREDGSLVIRAELPGIDPDKDIEITVTHDSLHIQAERRAEEKEEKRGYVRHELRYGSFSRTLPLPERVSESDIRATYKDGILEIRVPAPEPAPAKKVSVSKG